jgi:hypothetical protein
MKREDDDEMENVYRVICEQMETGFSTSQP